MSNIIKNINSNKELLFWCILNKYKFYIVVPNFNILITAGPQFIQSNNSDQWVYSVYQIPSITDIAFNGKYKNMWIGQKDRVTKYKYHNDKYEPILTTMLTGLNIVNVEPNTAINENFKINLNSLNRLSISAEPITKNDNNKWSIQNNILIDSDKNPIVQLPNVKTGHIEPIDQNLILIVYNCNNPENLSCGFYIVDINKKKIAHTFELSTLIWFENIIVKVA